MKGRQEVAQGAQSDLAEDNKFILNQAAEIKIRAERRAGELIPPDKDKGGGDTSTGNRVLPVQTPPKLSDLGISKMQSSRWQAIASIPEEDFEAHTRATGLYGLWPTKRAY